MIKTTDGSEIAVEWSGHLLYPRTGSHLAVFDKHGHWYARKGTALPWWAPIPLLIFGAGAVGCSVTLVRRMIGTIIRLECGHDLSARSSRVRLRTLTAMAVIAVSPLAACGGSTGKAATPSSSGTPTTTAAASAPSSPPVPHGPVLNGSSYSIALPPGTVIAKHDNVPWSHSFHRTKDALYDIDGLILEDYCDCRATDDSTGLSRLAKQAIRSQKVTNTEVRRVADVTLAGQRFAHVTSYRAAPPGSGHAYDIYLDEFKTYYAGRTLDITVNLMGTKARHAELETLLAQSLATLRLK